MKFISQLLAFSFLISARYNPTGETLKGRVIAGYATSPDFRVSGIGAPGVHVFLLKNIGRSDTCYVISNDSGYFTFSNLTAGDYDIVIPANRGYVKHELLGVPVPVERSFCTVNLLSYPAIEYNIESNTCGYEKSIPKPICHICHQQDQVVPIVYGRPAHATIKRAKKKEIHLGGCVRYKCHANWYCNRDSAFVMQMGK